MEDQAKTLALMTESQCRILLEAARAAHDRGDAARYERLMNQLEAIAINPGGAREPAPTDCDAAPVAPDDRVSVELALLTEFELRLSPVVQALTRRRHWRKLRDITRHLGGLREAMSQ